MNTIDYGFEIYSFFCLPIWKVVINVSLTDIENRQRSIETKYRYTTCANSIRTIEFFHNHGMLRTVVYNQISNGHNTIKFHPIRLCNYFIRNAAHGTVKSISFIFVVEIMVTDIWNSTCPVKESTETFGKRLQWNRASLMILWDWYSCL